MIFKRILCYFAISFLFFSLATKKELQNEEKILWCESKKLTWDDFKGLADSTDVFTGAITYCEIKIDETHFDNKIPIYRIGCYFIKNKSWRITNDNYSLAHEQLHFDIAELFARKIRKAYDSLNKKRIMNVEPYKKVFNMYGTKLEKYQNLYDNEVYFNEKKQVFWSKKIASELVNYKKWEHR